MFWLGLGIVGAIIWIVIAFWPARVAGAQRAQLLGIFRIEPVLLPALADHGVRRGGPHRIRRDLTDVFVAPLGSVAV